MNQAVSGTITTLESGRPLCGLALVATRLDGRQLRMLGATLSGDYGRFHIEYSRQVAPVDLTLLIFGPGGRLLFVEPVHRQVCGSELRLQVEVPQDALTKEM